MYPWAPQPEIVRASQKDSETLQTLREECQDLASLTFGQRANQYSSEIDFLCASSYFLFSTGFGISPVDAASCVLETTKKLSHSTKVGSWVSQQAFINNNCLTGLNQAGICNQLVPSRTDTNDSVPGFARSLGEEYCSLVPVVSHTTTVQSTPVVQDGHNPNQSLPIVPAVVLSHLDFDSVTLRSSEPLELEESLHPDLDLATPKPRITVDLPSRSTLKFLTTKDKIALYSYGILSPYVLLLLSRQKLAALTPQPEKPDILLTSEERDKRDADKLRLLSPFQRQQYLQRKRREQNASNMSATEETASSIDSEPSSSRWSTRISSSAPFKGLRSWIHRNTARGKFLAQSSAWFFTHFFRKIRNFGIKLARLLLLIAPEVQSVHLAVFYLCGGYFSLAHRLSGIKRIALSSNPSVNVSYRSIGWMLSLRLIVGAIRGIYGIFSEQKLRRDRIVRRLVRHIYSLMDVPDLDLDHDGQSLSLSNKKIRDDIKNRISTSDIGTFIAAVRSLGDDDTSTRKNVVDSMIRVNNSPHENQKNVRAWYRNVSRASSVSELYPLFKPGDIDVDSGIEDSDNEMEPNDTQNNSNSIENAQNDIRPSPECAICFCPRENASATLCGHVFCWDCISQALSVRPECPVCRDPCQTSQILRIFQYK